MGAAPGVDGNLAQALRALLGGGIGGRRVLAHARDQGVDRSDDKEIDRRRDQQEIHQRGDEDANREGRRPNGEGNRGEVRLADQKGNNRFNQRLDQGSHNSAKSRANHDADRHVDHIATKNELLETREHASLQENERAQM